MSKGSLLFASSIHSEKLDSNDNSTYKRHLRLFLNITECVTLIFLDKKFSIENSSRIGALTPLSIPCE